MLQKKPKIFNIEIKLNDFLRVVNPEGKMYYCRVIGFNAKRLKLMSTRFVGDRPTNYLIPDRTYAEIITRIKQGWQYSILRDGEEEVRLEP